MADRLRYVVTLTEGLPHRRGQELESSDNSYVAFHVKPIVDLI